MDNRNKTSNKDSFELYQERAEVYYKAYLKLFNNRKINEIVKWIQSPEWINYYELGRYILVHSFIPLNTEDWRRASDEEWEEAMWGCPYQLYLCGGFFEEEQKEKILVCGHWHTSDFYNNLLYRDDSSIKLDHHTDNPIFISDKCPGLIGLDTCTVLTKKVNILVIKEDEL